MFRLTNVVHMVWKKELARCSVLLSLLPETIGGTKISCDNRPSVLEKVMRVVESQAWADYMDNDKHITASEVMSAAALMGLVTEYRKEYEENPPNKRKARKSSRVERLKIAASWHYAHVSASPYRRRDHSGSSYEDDSLTSFREALVNILNDKEMTQSIVAKLGLADFSGSSGDEVPSIQKYTSDEPQTAAQGAVDGIILDLLRAQIAAARNLPYWPDDSTRPELKDVYVPLSLKPYGTSSDGKTSMDFALVRHRHLLIIGDAGAGKSTLAVQTVARTSMRILDSGGVVEENVWVPVYVPAPLITHSSSLHNAIASALNCRLGVSLMHTVQETIFSVDCPGVEGWIVFIDGIDEIVDTSNRTRLIRQLSGHLTDQADVRRFRFVFLTRRLDDSALNPLNSINVGRYEVTGFDEKQLGVFASSWLRISIPTAHESGISDTMTGGFLEKANDLGIGEAIKIPLLATLALSTYCKNSLRLPATIPQIYESFVTSLLFDRQARVKARRRIREIFEDVGPDGDDFAEQLYQRRQDICSYVAYRWRKYFEYEDDDRSFVIIANEWVVRELGKVPYVQQWERQLENILVDTGLITRQGSHLTFIHQTVAEYLAAPIAGLPQGADLSGSYCEELDIMLYKGEEQYLIFRIFSWATKNNASQLFRHYLAFCKKEYHQYQRKIEDIAWYQILHKLVTYGLSLDAETMREYVDFYMKVHRDRRHGNKRYDPKLDETTYSFDADYVKLLDILVSEHPNLAERLLKDEYDKYLEFDARLVGLLPLWRLDHREFVEDHLTSLIKKGRDYWYKFVVIEFYVEADELTKATNILNELVQDNRNNDLWELLRDYVPPDSSEAGLRLERVSHRIKHKR